MEEQTKPWWQSKTVIASLITGICGVLVLFGVKEGGEVSEEAPGIADNIIGFITAIAALVAVWGRIKADKTLTK